MKGLGPPGWQIVDKVVFHCGAHCGGGHVVPFSAQEGDAAEAHAAVVAAASVARVRAMVTLAARGTGVKRLRSVARVWVTVARGARGAGVRSVRRGR
jgi:hypothetical protein